MPPNDSPENLHGKKPPQADDADGEQIEWTVTKLDPPSDEDIARIREEAGLTGPIGSKASRPVRHRDGTSFRKRGGSGGGNNDDKRFA